MATRVTGIVRIKIDGKLLSSKEGAKLSGVLGVEREEVLSAFGVAGYKEKPVAPRIECTLIHDALTRLKSLDFTDATVNFECDSGVIYSLQGAFNASSLGVTAGGGETEMVIIGERCEEIG